MEIFELRYFLGVARTQNIHQASENLFVSPASLSKAISRLEDELSVKLFHREGRNIRLSVHGKLLQKRASVIVRLEEATKLELAGQPGDLQVVMAGAEILLSKMGTTLAQALKKKFPLARFEFRATDDETAMEWVRRGEVHLAVVTADISSGVINEGLTSKVIEETKFQTYVGQSHPLFAAAKAKRAVSVESVLQHAFVSPNNPLLGRVGSHQSLDGWRDDEFPRKIDYLTSSLKLLEELVVAGKAIAYLPDYFGHSLDVEILKVTGCPYTCTQKVRIVARNPKELGWLNSLF